MEVKEIIKVAATYLQSDDILNSVTFGGTVPETDEVTKEINLMLTCVNLVNNIIANDYLRLFKTVKVSSADGKINYSSISDKINDIFGVTDEYGATAHYSVFDNYIKTIPGNVEIKYAYFLLPTILFFSFLRRSTL